MDNNELTERECSICMSALVKCCILEGYLNAGLPVTLTKKNFGFPEMTSDEEEALVQKLHDYAQIAWLKERRG